MRVTDLAIKYRKPSLVLTFLMVVGGVGSYVTLPKESSPSIEIPYIVVTTIYPGASPSGAPRPGPPATRRALTPCNPVTPSRPSH